MSRRKIHTATTKSNVTRPDVVVKLFEVMPDGSGAPAVLEYRGFAFAFDTLGIMTLRLLRVPESGTRIGSKIARDVCKHTYVTLLETRVDDAWRTLNILMYDDYDENSFDPCLSFYHPSRPPVVPG